MGRGKRKGREWGRKEANWEGKEHWMKKRKKGEETERRSGKGKMQTEGEHIREES